VAQKGLHGFCRRIQQCAVPKKSYVHAGIGLDGHVEIAFREETMPLPLICPCLERGIQQGRCVLASRSSVDLPHADVAKAVRNTRKSPEGHGSLCSDRERESPVLPVCADGKLAKSGVRCGCAVEGC